MFFVFVCTVGARSQTCSVLERLLEVVDAEQLLEQKQEQLKSIDSKLQSLKKVAETYVKNYYFIVKTMKETY